jgi:hypothetical protein
MVLYASFGVFLWALSGLLLVPLLSLICDLIEQTFRMSTSPETQESPQTEQQESQESVEYVQSSPVPTTHQGFEEMIDRTDKTQLMKGMGALFKEMQDLRGECVQFRQWVELQLRDMAARVASAEKGLGSAVKKLKKMTPHQH